VQSALAINDAIAGLSAEALDRLVWHARMMADKERHERDVSAILNHGTDVEIERLGEREWRTPTVVVASIYGRESAHYTDPFCIVPWPLAFHPRRPVVMRGAKARMVYKHSRSRAGCPNGYADEVMTRYLRFIKYTCFDPDKANDDVRAIGKRLQRRYVLTYQFWRGWSYPVSIGDNKYHCFVNGRHVWLDRNQYDYVKALHGIIRKTDNLDRRRELLREYRRQRTAREVAA
jgi:hypothetical protein